MIGLWLLFVRLIVRPLWREPVRTALTVFAVALGVGVVIAMDLAGQSAAEGFHASVESLAGKADLEITITGGIDEKLIGKLVQLPDPLAFSPRIEDFAFLPARGEAIPFLGLDLIGDPNIRALRTDGGDSLAMERGAPIWAGARLGFHGGQQVKLLVNDQLREFTVQAVLNPPQSEISEGNFILADIGLAQKVTGKAGRLDSITVKLPPGRDAAYWEKVLRGVLPAAAQINPRGTRSEQNRRMLSAFRWNLRILSYISLLVGAFLIYNTVSISVVRRRSEIGVARALGATRAMILSAFVGEALFFAALGGALGILFGRAMATGAVALVNGTVQALYVTGQAGSVGLSPRALLSGVGLGLLISLLASLAPAFEASHIPPVEAMAHGRAEYVAGLRSRGTWWWIAVLLIAAAVLTRLPPLDGHPVAGYLAVLLLIGATAGAVPITVRAFTGVTQRLVARLLRVEGLLASRSLRASLARTSILTAALATAIAMTSSVGIMVGSFRQTLTVWMENQLKADLYLRPAAVPGADRYPTMSAEIADQIEKLPGVASLDRFRAYSIVYQGSPATLAGGTLSRILKLPMAQRLRGESEQSISRKLSTGDYAFVSEPFASKHDVRPGSVLPLPIAGADRKFTVLAIYYDYSTERGLVMLDRATLLRYLPDPALSSLAVYKQPGADTDAVRKEVDTVLQGRAVFVADNGQLRRAALAIVDNTFRITYALEAVAIFVAVMGIAGALLALVIDRKREFALLRFLGAAQTQVRQIILCEAGLLGLLANVIGLVLGTVLSLILIFVINKQSFGWTLQFHWPVTLMITALTGVYAATLLAALYPSRIAMKLNPIEVIHEE